jgi:signal transduction histidine kinase
MQRLFSFVNFLISLGVDENDTYIQKQEIKNTNKGALIAFAFGTLCSLSTIKIVPTPYIYVPLIVCFLYLGSLLLNHLRMLKTASMSLWLISNLLFFWLANAYGKGSNAYMLFIIAEMVCILNFNLESTKSVLWVSIVPVILSIITFSTDFSLLNIPTITDKHRQLLGPMMFFMTLIGSGLAVWVYRQNLYGHVKRLQEMQNSLREKYSELEQVNLDLRKANEELDRFVYSVSHDLRAPITSVMGLLDLCENDEQNIKTYLQLQRKSVNKLDSFIKDILHYARNSRLEVIPEKVDFEQNLRETFADQSHAQSAQNLDFQVEIQGEEAIYTDEFRFNIIASNLISNAIRYRKTDIQTSFIHCKIHLSKEEAQIEVSDNGIGIPTQYQPYIFQMFYRANVKSTGSGLGLYIVKEALNKMGGKIEVKSEEGVGTTFKVIIPNLGKIKANKSIERENPQIVL